MQLALNTLRQKAGRSLKKPLDFLRMVDTFRKAKEIKLLQPNREFEIFTLSKTEKLILYACAYEDDLHEHLLLTRCEQPNLKIRS